MDKIEELLTRGVERIYPTREELEKILRSGKKLKLYQGFDPTGTQLHIGHMVGLKKLAQWQKLGHKVIFLIGDFTALIGDPSGKSESRKPLDQKEVEKNAKQYKDQATRILDFSGDNSVEIRFNSEWLRKMSWTELIRISRLLSVQQVIERDLFQERLKKGQDIYMSEFFYPVMQAYDSVVMDVDVEVGGNDQMFNMLMGRKLMRNIKKKDKFVMTTPLLTDSTGQKIGKTEGNVIALTDEPEDLYRKIMALGDDVILKALEYLTDVSMQDIEKIKKAMERGENPVKYKKLLAFEVTKQLHSKNDANDAQAEFENVVQKGELPKDIKEVAINDETVIDEDFLADLGLASSKSEAKRLFGQKGVSLNGKKIKSGENPSEKESILTVGKKMIKLKRNV